MKALNIHLIQFLRLLKRKIKSDQIKISVGSANIIDDNTWFATDIDTLNITKQKDWEKFLWLFKADNIVAEHVWEHLTNDEAFLANKMCFKFLKKGGILRIAVPDGLHPDAEYINYVKPGGHGAGADDHKILYTYHIMKERLESVGFKVNLLEYWDENKQFHYKNWNNDAGLINRSKRYDDRNQNGKLNYTSLIVDAIKE